MNTRETKRSDSPLRSPLKFAGKRHFFQQPMNMTGLGLRKLAHSVSSNMSSSPPDAEDVALFAPIFAPILRSVHTIRVTLFSKERNCYEMEINVKKAEFPTLTAAPYSASINRSLLKSLFYMGKFDFIAPKASSVAELTNGNLTAYIKSITAV